MKKSQFQGIDRFVVERYKAPIEKFNGKEDFKKFCNNFTDNIRNENYLGRKPETTVQRKAMLKEWFDYVLKENTAYAGSIALMILGAITSTLKSNEDTLPPVLNKRVLADTVDEVQEDLENNPKMQLNFDKKYRLNLQKSVIESEGIVDKSLNGWIVIPSKEHDPEHFEENVDKLKALSHNNWCTKSYNAKPYLSEGDFHVYMKNGQPALGIRFVGDKIQEIQGERNNATVPYKYYGIAKEHIKDYELTQYAAGEVKELEEIKKYADNILAKFPRGVENYSTQEILEALGIDCEKDSDGLLIISTYRPPHNELSFSDFGIDENKLFKDIKAIKKNAELYDSQLTDLGNLESIGGYVAFGNTKITQLGKLREIGGTANFRNSKIKNLGNLQTIGGSAFFCESQIKSLGNLETIGGSAYFVASNVTDLSNLQTIGGSADFSHTQLTSLGHIQSIGGDATFEYSQITDLGDLKYIGGSAKFNYSKITDLKNLETIEQNAIFSFSKVSDLGKLKKIGSYAMLTSSPIKKQQLLNQVTSVKKIM